MAAPGTWTPTVLALLLLVASCMAGLADGRRPSTTYNAGDGPVPTPNDGNYTAEERDAMALQASYQINPDLDAAYNDTILEQEGSNAYQLRARGTRCIRMTKGWLKNRFGYPGCFPAQGRNAVGNYRWLCWFYATFYNDCAGRFTRTIYFNCCDKKNGLFYPLNPVPYYSGAPGPNMSPNVAACSCELKVTIEPGQAYHLHYLAYGAKNVQKSGNPHLTPWDTYVTAAKFWQ